MGIIKTLEPTHALHVQLDALLAQEEVILNAKVAFRNIIGIRQQRAHHAQLGVKLAQEEATINAQPVILVTTFNHLARQSIA